MSAGFDIIIPHNLSFTTIKVGVKQLEAILKEPIHIIELKRLSGTSLDTDYFDYSPRENCRGYRINTQYSRMNINT